MTLTILCILLAAAHVADAWSTILFRRAGILEANPVLRWLDGLTQGWGWLLVPKGIVILAQWAALWAYYPQDWVIIVRWVTIVLHAGIASHNLMTVRRK